MDDIDLAKTPCAICLCALESCYVQSYQGDKLVRVVCTDCDRDERYAAYQRDGHLSTWLVDDAQMVVYIADEARPGYWRRSSPQRVAIARRVANDVKALRPLIEAVDREVWLGGMATFARASGYKGTRLAAPIATKPKAEAGDAKVLCFTMCGRAMITIDAPACSVTLITEEDSDEPRMGLRGIDAKDYQARALLQGLLDAWRGGPSRGQPCDARPPESRGCKGTVRTGVEWVVLDADAWAIGPAEHASEQVVHAQCDEARIALFAAHLGVRQVPRGKRATRHNLTREM